MIDKNISAVSSAFEKLLLFDSQDIINLKEQTKDKIASKINGIVSYLNAYAQWIAGDKYFFVGVGHNSNLITTYFIKTIKYAKYLSLL